jgi:hypothetical protein
MRPAARLAGAVATAVTLACHPAAAQQMQVRAFFTGNSLWSLCTSDDAYDLGLCRGFVAGVADAMAIPGTVVLGWSACILLAVTTAQVQDVAKRYLEQHPETRHGVAANLVAAALAAAPMELGDSATLL